MKKMKRAIAAVLLAASMLLVVPTPARAECLTFDPAIWGLPVELIAWYLYWSDPSVLDAAAAAGVTTYDELLVWLAEHYCSYWGY